MAEDLMDPAYHETFKYDDIPPDNIRLLHLEGTSVPGELRFSLQPYARHEAPPYVAISYHWGDEPPIHEITLDGKAMFVRPYIWQALSHITTEAEVLNKEWTHFWCDAICINQADTREKTEQIRRMLRTFGDAHVVVAWLGPKHAGSESGNTTEALEHPNWHSLLPRFSLISWRRDLWGRELFCRPYLYRIWVVQELIAARKVIFLLGRARLTYLDVASIWVLGWRQGGSLVTYALTPRDTKYEWLLSLPRGSRPMSLGLLLVFFYLSFPLSCVFLIICVSVTVRTMSGSQLGSMLSEVLAGMFGLFAHCYFVTWLFLEWIKRMKVPVENEPWPDLETWLEFTIHSRYSNPKDRVFALLGLLHDNERGILEMFFPDYDLSLERIQMITLAFLRQESSSSAHVSKLGEAIQKLKFAPTSSPQRYCELLHISSPDLADEMSTKTTLEEDLVGIMKEFNELAKVAWRAGDGGYRGRLGALRQRRLDELRQVASKPLSSELEAQVQLLKQKAWYIPQD